MQDAVDFRNAAVFHKQDAIITNAEPEFAAPLVFLDIGRRAFGIGFDAGEDVISRLSGNAVEQDGTIAAKEGEAVPDKDILGMNGTSSVLTTRFPAMGLAHPAIEMAPSHDGAISAAPPPGCEIAAGAECLVKIQPRSQPQADGAARKGRAHPDPARQAARGERREISANVAAI